MKTGFRTVWRTWIEEAIGACDWTIAIRDEYAGREFAKPGFAVVFKDKDPQAVQEFFVQLALKHPSTAENLVRDSQTDDMAKGRIVYFPNWRFMYDERV